MITVIYDGNCDFCKSCVEWAMKRAQLIALPNQDLALSEYGLTQEQVEKSVVVVSDKTYFGAAAVAQVLIVTGNPGLSKLIGFLGPISELSYKYIATHRNGLLVKLLHAVIRRTS
jgi:predicted DCC family thiol-disulfide oxidoreductase YuxK